MNILQGNIKAIIGFLILIVGLVVALVLVRNPQIFKSHASAQGLMITAPNQTVNFQGNNQFSTNADSISFGVQDLSALK